MAVTMQEIEVWVVVDENGDYAVGKDRESAGEAFESDIGVDNDTSMRRVKITVKVPLPEVIELTGTVATVEEPGELQAA